MVSGVLITDQHLLVVVVVVCASAITTLQHDEQRPSEEHQITKRRIMNLHIKLGPPNIWNWNGTIDSTLNSQFTDQRRFFFFFVNIFIPVVGSSCIPYIPPQPNLLYREKHKKQHRTTAEKKLLFYFEDTNL